MLAIHSRNISQTLVSPFLILNGRIIMVAPEVHESAVLSRVAVFADSSAVNYSCRHYCQAHYDWRCHQKL